MRRWPQVYLFFETKSVHNSQGDIGAAVSEDGGLSFKHLGVVLDDAEHLSYPFVLQEGDQVTAIVSLSSFQYIR